MWAVIFFFMSIPVLLSQDINDGLIAFYPMDGNVLDRSGNERHGVVTGNPEYGYCRWDYPNSCILLDGTNDYVVFPIGEHKTLAVSLWVKALMKNDSATIFDYGDSEFRSQIDARTTATNPAYTIFHYITDKLVFTNASMMYFTDWHHLYIDTGDETRGPRVFIDGFPDKAVQQKVVLKAISELFYLGRKAGDASLHTYFHGELDDIRIYNRLLAANEIAVLFALDPKSVAKQMENRIKIYQDFDKKLIFISTRDIAINHVQIISVKGEIIESNITEGLIDLQNFKRGLYFLRFIDKEGKSIHIRKFICY